MVSIAVLTVTTLGGYALRLDLRGGLLFGLGYAATSVFLVWRAVRMSRGKRAGTMLSTWWLSESEDSRLG